MAQTIQFLADKVTVKTGRVDNSAVVSFEVGEYELANITKLVPIRDSVLRVAVEVEE